MFASLILTTFSLLLAVVSSFAAPISYVPPFDPIPQAVAARDSGVRDSVSSFVHSPQLARREIQHLERRISQKVKNFFHKVGEGFKKVGRFLKSHIVDIVTTAVGFIPGVGTAISAASKVALTAVRVASAVKNGKALATAGKALKAGVDAAKSQAKDKVQKKIDEKTSSKPAPAPAKTPAKAVTPAPAPQKGKKK